MFSRPFTIGDWVEIGDNQGVVTDITIFNTRLENFDGEFIVIPNDQVSDRSVTNRSRKGLLRLRTDVGVDYEADVETARAVALDAMEDVDAVVTSPQPQVVPKGFGDSAILLELRYWIDHPSPPLKWRAVSAVVTAVKAAFDDAGSLSRTPSGLSPGARRRPSTRMASARISTVTRPAARSVSPHRATRTTSPPAR